MKRLFSSRFETLYSNVLRRFRGELWHPENEENGLNSSFNDSFLTEIKT
jgi:hypothetical protein